MQNIEQRNKKYTRYFPAQSEASERNSPANKRSSTYNQYYVHLDQCDQIKNRQSCPKMISLEK